MARRVAAALVIFYILVQAVQEVVLAAQPDELARSPMNLARAGLMFVSFFGLLFAFLVLCLENVERRRASSAFAFLGLFIFCLLEIGLRAVELFWAVLQQPGPDKLAIFAAIEAALYVPLMLAQALASVVLAFAFAPPRRRWNGVVRFVFGVNAARLAGRLAGTILHVGAFDVLSGSLYFPLVLVVYAPIALWLWTNR